MQYNHLDFWATTSNKHFTLKTNPLRRDDLKDFIKCYNPENRYQRKETWSENNPGGRWKKYTYEEILDLDISHEFRPPIKTPLFIYLTTRGLMRYIEVTSGFEPL